MTGASQLLDLVDPRFWAVAGVAVLALTPLASLRLRDAVWGAVNLGAIAFLLGLDTAWVAALFALAIWLAARTARRASAGRVVFFVSLAVLLLLFGVHKLDVDVATGPAKPLLAALGYSYVALRVVELLRAMREARHPAPTLISTLNYLFPFHMLAAGPIQAYDDFAGQPIAPRLGHRSALEAVERVVLGLFKKFVIAPVLATVFLTGFTAGGLYSVLEVQVFYLWVYLDFSAYSDIAVGLGRLMGVRTPENFDRPLSARNITVFWERWHISLSLFIRRNLFTPVQLALVRRYTGASPLMSATLAFTVAFLLCGLWHGLTQRFLIWGALHALALVICNAYRHGLRARVGRKRVKRYLENRLIRWAATLLTFEFVAFSIAFALYPGRFSWE